MKKFYSLLAVLLLFLSPMPAQAQTRTFTVKGVSFKMVFVKGGTFTMGATSEQGSDAHDNEKPTHRVTLSDYYIGQTEVTQALWKAVMGMGNERIKWFKFKGNNLPVEFVSWGNCQKFIRKLNEMTEGLRPNGRKFRLPTEAEWEFAARGGIKSRHTKYAGSNDVSSVAWCDYLEQHRGSTHPVAQKSPNELGLYDMSGNVSEWCQDYADGKYYNRSPSKNPCNKTESSYHVFRGGSWGFTAFFCRVSWRGGKCLADEDTGFRLAL